jgi:hypothetical protein
VLAVCVQRAVQHQRHQFEQVVGVAHRAERETATGLRHRRPRAPLQPQPLDEQSGAGTLEDCHAVLDAASDKRVVAPFGRDEAEVLGRCRPGRDDLGRGGLHQPYSGVDPVGIRCVVVEIEDVEVERGVGAPLAPPRQPGQDTVAA